MGSWATKCLPCGHTASISPMGPGTECILELLQSFDPICLGCQGKALHQQLNLACRRTAWACSAGTSFVYAGGLAAQELRAHA